MALFLTAMSSDDLIRHLCERVIAAEGAEFDATLRELQAGLKAHTEGLKAMAIAHAPENQGYAPRSGRPLEPCVEPDDPIHLRFVADGGCL